MKPSRSVRTTVRNPDPFHRPMFIFCSKGSMPMPARTVPQGEPLSTGSFQSDFLLFLHDALPPSLNCPGTSHGRTCGTEQGKRRERKEEGEIYFARVVHRWDEGTNCIFRRATRVNTVSSTHSSSSSSSPVLFARDGCVLKCSPRGECSTTLSLTETPLPQPCQFDPIGGKMVKVKQG